MISQTGNGSSILPHNIYIKLPINVTFHHVKGHQDKAVPFDNLLWQEILNTFADTAPKSIVLNNSIQTNQARSHDILPYAKFLIMYTDRQGIQHPISSKLVNTQRHLIHKDNIRAYWV